MIIKSSTSLRSDYTNISDLARETEEPIYITKNGEGDMVVMSLEAFEKREQRLKLKERLLKAEESRIKGEETISTEDAKMRLKEMYKKHE